MAKKKICWITDGYLLQVDYPILPKLSLLYDIHWVVIAKVNSNGERAATQFSNEHNINLEIRSGRGHRYLPFCLIDYIPMCKQLASLDADIYYCNWTPFPYAWIPFEKYIPSEKLIMAMHHGSIHDGMQLKHLYKYYLKHIINREITFQYFSETQANGEFATKNKKKEIIPLALNYYGKTEKLPSNEYIEFLFFGHIIETKNIGILIKAANSLFEITDKKFKIRIVGQCRQWNLLYKPLIKYPEIFDLDIRMVPDDLIPELFSTAHYLVLPYKAVTQSGPLRIAYGYNTPVISSDLPGFKESMEDGVTGFMFKSDDEKSLLSLMKQLVDGGIDLYYDIKTKQKEYVSRNFYVSSVIEKYIKMFEKIGYEH